MSRKNDILRACELFVQPSQKKSSNNNLTAHRSLHWYASRCVVFAVTLSDIDVYVRDDIHGPYLFSVSNFRIKNSE